MGIVYDIAEELERIMQKQPRFKAAQAQPGSQQAMVTQVAQKLLKNIETNIQPNVGQGGDPEVFVRDLSSFNRFIEYITKNAVQINGSPLVIQAKDLQGGVDKSKLVKYNNVFLYKDGVLSYIQELQKKATQDGNKLAQVMIGTLFEEANQILGRAQGQTQTDLTMDIPRNIDIQNPMSGNPEIKLPLSALGDLGKAGQFCQQNQMTYQNGQEKGQIADNKTVCMFVTWLVTRINGSNMEAQAKQQFAAAAERLSQLCQVGQTGGTAQQGQGAKAMAQAMISAIGDPFNDDVLDLTQLENFFAVFHKWINDNIGQFTRNMAVLYREQPDASEARVKELQQNMVDGINMLNQIRGTWVRKTTITPSDVQDSGGYDAAGMFMNRIMRPNMKKVDGKHCADMINQAIGQALQLIQIVPDREWVKEQGQYADKWTDRLSNISQLLYTDQ